MLLSAFGGLFVIDCDFCAENAYFLLVEWSGGVWRVVLLAGRAFCLKKGGFEH